MNMQAMMQQAQKLQRDIAKAKQEIEQKSFKSKKSFIEIEANGKKQITSIKIDKDIDLNDERETLEDLIMLTTNELINQIEKATEEKLGKFGPGLNGLM